MFECLKSEDVACCDCDCFTEEFSSPLYITCFKHSSIIKTLEVRAQEINKSMWTGTRADDATAYGGQWTIYIVYCIDFWHLAYRRGIGLRITCR